MSEREEEIEWVLAENKYGPRDAMRGFYGYNVRGMAVDIIALRQRVSELGEQLAAAKADAGNILAGRRAEADALHQRLSIAERERDEARRERDALNSGWRRLMRHRAERAEQDGVLLNFLADDPPFDVFHDMDLYETWGEVAAKYGREEANDDDKREAFRLLLSRALDAAEGTNA